MIDLPHARRLAFGVVLGQATVTLIAALAAWAAGGRLSALSALAGGGIGTGANLVMALVAFGGRPADAQRAVQAFYLGELLKLVLAVVLFTVTFLTVKVAPLAMFAAFVATFIVYWIALAGPLWSAVRSRGRQAAQTAQTVRD